MGRKVEQGASYRGLNYLGESRHLLRLIEAIQGDHRHDLGWKRTAISLLKKVVNHINEVDEHGIEPDEGAGTN